MDRRRFAHRAVAAAAIFSWTLFGVVLFHGLSRPLMWHDEATTAVFAERVLAHGYPKVHGEKNVLSGVHYEAGVRPELDAYVGSPWAQHFFAAIGVALAADLDDPYRRTAILRAPFAIAGALGVVLLFGLAARECGRERRVELAALFGSALACSTSLVLHLRQVRHYALDVLLVAGCVAVYARRRLQGGMGWGAYTASLAALLTGLFHTFYAAFGALLVAMGLHVAWGAWRSDAPAADRLRRLARDAAPLLIAAGLALPFVRFYRVLDVIGALAGEYTLTLGTWAESLGAALANQLRYEFLAPALAARLGVVAALGRRAWGHERLRVANFLWLLIVVWDGLVSRTPFAFERYFVALGPIVTTALLLDVFALAGLARGTVSATRRRALGALALTAACAAASVALRAPEITGRLREMREPFRGPLDYAIPYLLEHHPAPEELIVATNYEDPAFMYYLRARTIVGYFSQNLRDDLEQSPDVIVPRPWAQNMGALVRLARRDVYEPVEFPVANTMTNNTPTLSARGPGGAPFVHRFETPLADTREDRLRIYVRAGLRAAPGER